MKPDQLSILEVHVKFFDSLMRQDLNAAIHSPTLIQIIDHIIFNGGKRIRPILTILMHGLCQQGQINHQTKAYTLGLCFEYTHAASLLHDDVIDGASWRRQQKSANEIWGNTNIILAGDFLHSRALFLAGTQGGMECLEIMCKAVGGMIESEYLQLENTVSQDLSAAYYFNVVQGKTAMLISAACECGCIVAAGTPEQRLAARTFGNNLGLAFQLIDDALDYAGDIQKTGKTPGNDWREQRVTLPLICALETLNETDRQWLLGEFSASRGEREQSFVRVAGLIKQAGGLSRAHQKARQLVEDAVAALAIFPDGEDKRTLTALSQYLLDRER